MFLRDEKVIEAMKRNDEAAMNLVMNQYVRLLWKIVRAVLNHVGTTEDIEECVADAFVYLWENPEKYDPQRGSLKLWLSMVARSRAINRYRQLRRCSDISLEEAYTVAQGDILDGILIAERKQGLAKAIKSLSELEQEILMRRYYDEQKPKEIALALDMPVKHVQNHLYQAKRKLRDEMKYAAQEDVI